MSDEKEYRAIVEKVIRKGPHGPYAVARSEDLGTDIGSVTFSLDQPVWQEDDWPEPGMCVMLSRVRRKRAGWRATSGRFMKPSDEQQQQQSNRSRKEKRTEQ